MKSLAFIFAAVFLCITAHSQVLPTKEQCLPSIPKVEKLTDFNNGCGSGWNEVLVPDKARLLGVDFSRACAAHDNCYSKCLPGGEKYCEPVCFEQAKAQREGRRARCDEEFFEDMIGACSSAACRGAAFVYFWSVKIGGGGNFQGYEIPPDVRQALLSGQVTKFDYLLLTKEIEEAKSLFVRTDRNRVRLKIENGEPVVFISATNTIRSTPPLEVFSAVSSRTIVKYGSVDISESQLKGGSPTPARIDFKKIDPSKLLYQKKFEIKPITQ